LRAGERRGALLRWASIASEWEQDDVLVKPRASNAATLTDGSFQM